MLKSAGPFASRGGANISDRLKRLDCPDSIQEFYQPLLRLSTNKNSYFMPSDYAIVQSGSEMSRRVSTSGEWGIAALAGMSFEP